MSTNSATSVNTVRDLQRVLEDHLVDPSEFFTEGCCWAYAYALCVKLSATAFMIEKPSHVWIEQNGRAYDGRCGGVPRQELLRRFFDGPYVPEKAVAEAARLAGASQPLALSELERFYNSQKVLGKKRYNIAWDLALSFAEQVFAVQLAATAFRAAIERCDRTGLSIAFQYFQI